MYFGIVYILNTKISFLFIDKEAALRLSELVTAAVQLLVDYNARLTNELERRRKAATALRDFAQAQKDLTKQAEERLEVLIFPSIIF